MPRIKPTVYLFKVALKGHQRVWRRVPLRSDQSLHDLHQAIFDAFDRFDEHLYSFYFPPPGSRGRAWLRDAKEYTHPDVAAGPHLFADDPTPNAARTNIASLGLGSGQRFYYLFDFGDSWWHEITVEQTDGVDDHQTYPRVIEQRGDSPPQYPEVEEDEA